MPSKYTRLSARNVFGEGGLECAWPLPSDLDLWISFFLFRGQ